MNNLKEARNEYFTYEGRITRETYVLRVLGRWAASIVVMIIAYLLMFLIYSITYANDNMFITIIIFYPIALLVGLTFFFFKIFQEMKRLHDMNSSGWGVIFGFIPLVNIIYYLLLIFNDGTVGPNEYGEDPKGRGPKTIEYEEKMETV